MRVDGSVLQPIKEADVDGRIGSGKLKRCAERATLNQCPLTGGVMRGMIPCGCGRAQNPFGHAEPRGSEVPARQLFLRLYDATQNPVSCDPTGLERRRVHAPRR